MVCTNIATPTNDQDMHTSDTQGMSLTINTGACLIATIGAITLTCWKTGTPTGYIKLYRTTGTYGNCNQPTLGTGDLINQTLATALESVSGSTYTFTINTTFSAGDIFYIYYSGGDASNKITVRRSNATSGAIPNVEGNWTSSSSTWHGANCGINNGGTLLFSTGAAPSAGGGRLPPPPIVLGGL